MRVVVFIIIVFLISGVAKAQVNYSTKSRKAIKAYQEAELLLRQRRFSEGISKLNEALEKDNDFIEAHLRLAFSYELLRNTKGQEYHPEAGGKDCPKFTEIQECILFAWQGVFQ
jgi:OOP family OmpA-OmpF porin